MPLRYLLDEHLHGALWRAIQQHNVAGNNPLDTLCVGDPSDLLLGATDSDNLLWAEREGRILVSLDKNTLPGHLVQHLQSGHRSPGVLLIRPGRAVAQVVSFLVIAAYASDPADWQDRWEYIP